MCVCVLQEHAPSAQKIPNVFHGRSSMKSYGLTESIEAIKTILARESSAFKATFSKTLETLCKPSGLRQAGGGPMPSSVLAGSFILLGLMLLKLDF